MTDPRAEHDRALRAALLGPDDPAALDAAIARETPPKRGSLVAARGLDPDRLVEPTIKSDEDRAAMRSAWAALGQCTADGATPRAVLLDPEQWPEATGMLGLPIERREGQGLGVVLVAAQGMLAEEGGYSEPIPMEDE